MSQPAPRRFTVREYHRMAEVGILEPRERVELLEGEIVAMSPAGSRHAACVSRLAAILQAAVGGTAIVRVQSPLRLSDVSEPEPDLAVVRPRDDWYASAHPTAADVLLLVEVSDSSLSYDRGVKAAAYGAARIAEYWIVDLASDNVTVMAGFAYHGFDVETRHGRGSVLEPAGIPGARIAVSDVLG